jgi:hypothetical protein
MICFHFSLSHLQSLCVKRESERENKYKFGIYTHSQFRSLTHSLTHYESGMRYGKKKLDGKQAAILFYIIAQQVHEGES